MFEVIENLLLDLINWSPFLIVFILVMNLISSMLFGRD